MQNIVTSIQFCYGIGKISGTPNYLQAWDKIIREIAILYTTASVMEFKIKPHVMTGGGVWVQLNQKQYIIKGMIH